MTKERFKLVIRKRHGAWMIDLIRHDGRAWNWYDGSVAYSYAEATSQAAKLWVDNLGEPTP